MMEWKEVKLGDVIDFMSGGTPNKQNADYWNGTIPWISAKTMYVDYIETSDLFISKEGLENGSKLAPMGTILLLTRGSGLFNNIPVCKVVKPVAFNQDVKCLFSKDENVLTNDFLFYWLYGNKSTIAGILETTGIGAGKIDTQRFLSLPINIPNLEVQKKLINFAVSIMGKIETNNKINANLEEMAQAIFKNWFVDFAPFKDGKFVESELGMIPEGWRVGTLSEVIDIKYGKDHKKLEEGEIPVYGSGGLKRKVSKSLYNGESVLIPRKGTLNNILYVNEEFWTVDTMFYTLPKIQSSMKYVYQYIRRFDFTKMNEGTSIPSTTTATLNGLQVLLPSILVLKKFDELLSPMYSKIRRNNEENARLASIRDTLLPRLMSGEIEV